MAKNIKLKASARVAAGSGAARRVRRAGGIPAAVTRLSRETDTFQLSAHDFMMATRDEAGENLIVELDFGGEPVRAMMREVQRDVMTGAPSHIDFTEIDMNKKVRASVLLQLVGEPEGVRTQNGILEQTLHELSVECLPAVLAKAESIEVDVTGLKLNETITVADLKLGDDYVVLTGGDTSIATVKAPAAEEEPAPAAEEAAGGDAAAAPAADPKAAPAKDADAARK